MHIEHQLEEIIQQQRLQLFFASRLWLEARKENGQLRQVISILEARLEEAGVSTEAPPAPDNQPGLPLFRTFHETSPTEVSPR